MEMKNLLIACTLTGIVIVILCILPFVSPYSNNTDNSMFMQDNTTFNAKTPEEKAIFVARLNDGIVGFEWDTIVNTSLTSDGKYWIVKMGEAGYDDWIVTVDAKTLMSKSSRGSGKNRQNKDRWRSFDELKASYIAEIQSVGSNGGIGEPIKITMDDKEVWKVPVYYIDVGDGQEQVEYVYVDTTTGQSKNELYNDNFKEIAGTDDWLTVKEVDDTITKFNNMHNLPVQPFRNALRDLYPE